MASELPRPPPETPGAPPSLRSTDGGNDDNTPGDVGPDGQAKRKRQPRNSACRACANLKMKCVPSATPGICERCHRMNRDCLPAVPKPRKKRSTVGAEDEDEQSTSPTAPDDQQFATPLPRRGHPGTPKQPTSSASAAPKDVNPPDSSYRGSKSFEAMLSHGLGLDRMPSVPLDLLRGVDYNKVQNSVAIYHGMQARFPLIEIAANADVGQLASRKPMLTLAICTVTSTNTAHVQDRLAHTFKTALAQKTIVLGERNLDVMQGLMVYLAWNHYFLGKKQLYQELHLLAGMAIDLGLNTKSRRQDPARAAIDLEYDRSFIGVYFLCTGISILSLKKPTPLRFTDALRRCAESVAQFGTHQEDKILIPMVELMCAAEQIADTVENTASGAPAMPPHLLDVHIRSVKARFAVLKREHPALSNIPAYTAATIHFNTWLIKHGTSMDSSHLIQCACVIKEYLDDILHRPPGFLHHCNVVDWSTILDTLLQMVFVSKPNTYAHGWEAGALATMLQPETMLDAICNHMAAAPANDPLAPRHEALLHSLRNRCQKIKLLIARERGGSAAGQHDLRHYGQRSGADMPGPIFQGIDPTERSGHGVLDDEFWANMG